MKTPHLLVSDGGWRRNRYRPLKHALQCVAAEAGVVPTAWLSYPILARMTIDTLWRIDRHADEHA